MRLVRSYVCPYTPPLTLSSFFSTPPTFPFKKRHEMKIIFFIFYTCKENIYQNVLVFSQYTLTVFIKCITKISIFPQFFNHWKIPFCLYICHRKYRAHMLKYSDFMLFLFKFYFNYIHHTKMFLQQVSIRSIFCWWKTDKIFFCKNIMCVMMSFQHYLVFSLITFNSLFLTWFYQPLPF